MRLTLHAAVFAAVLLAAAANCPSTFNFAIGSYTHMKGVSTGEGVSLLTYSNSKIITTNTLRPVLVGKNPNSVAVSGNKVYALNDKIDATVTLVSVPSHASPPSSSPRTEVTLRTGGKDGVHIQKDGTLLVVTNFGRGKSPGSITTIRVGKTLTRKHIFVIPAYLAAAKRNPALKTNPILISPHPYAAVPFGGFYAVLDFGSRMVHLLTIDKATGIIKYRSSTKTDQLHVASAGVRHNQLGLLYVMNYKPPMIATMYLVKHKLQQRVAIKKQFWNDLQGKNTRGGAIRISKDGKFLYASIHYTKKNGAIVGFRLNKRTGEIENKISEVSTHGMHPRDFVIVDSFKYRGECVSAIAVVNWDSGNLVLIRRDIGPGTLHETALLSVAVKGPTSVIMY